MRANKLRTALTGFAIVWGILMVILLLSVSNGFHNGVMQNFNYMNANTISIYPGWVSKPYKGMPSDRKITFNPDDINKIRKGIGSLVNVVAFSPVYNVQNAAISYKAIYATPSIIGVCPDFIELRYMQMENGRFINAFDMESCDKVIVINENTADLLFGEDEPLGKYVTVSSLLFKVVGVYSEKGGSQNSPAYIPFETSQIIFNSSRQITDLSFMVEGMDDFESINNLKTAIRELVAGIKIFDPADEQALWIQDRREMVGAFNILFSVINVFMWIVGLASLLAGVVGVSNIMIVTVFGGITCSNLVVRFYRYDNRHCYLGGRRILLVTKSRDSQEHDLQSYNRIGYGFLGTVCIGDIRFVGRVCTCPKGCKS